MNEMNDGMLFTDHGTVGRLVDPAGQPDGAAVVRHHPRVVRGQEADGVAAPQHVCQYFLSDTNIFHLSTLPEPRSVGESPL